MRTNDSRRVKFIASVVGNVTGSHRRRWQNAQETQTGITKKTKKNNGQIRNASFLPYRVCTRRYNGNWKYGEKARSFSEISYCPSLHFVVCFLPSGNWIVASTCMRQCKGILHFKLLWHEVISDNSKKSFIRSFQFRFEKCGYVCSLVFLKAEVYSNCSS